MEGVFPGRGAARERCSTCHNGEPGRLLGFSALQLARESDLERLDLDQLAALGLLSSPPSGASYSLSGSASSGDGTDTDTDAAAALGYLHASCGNCHNTRGTAWPDTQMLLRLDADADG